MSQSNSTARTKPSKPHPDFPLFPHATGRWAKKIRGRMVYFGPWDDPDAALAKYEADKVALHSGLTPRDTSGLTVKDAANVFLRAKQAKVDTGELSPRTWAGYKQAADVLVQHMGKNRLVASIGPSDFAALRRKLAKRWGPHRLANTIQIIRSLFMHGYKSELIDKPMRYGPDFERPARKVIRLHRAEQGPKLFTADEIRRMIDAASQPMKAILLLGINCAFGNTDCGRLPLSALDLDAGWVDYPRPKTGIPRRCPLWPETVAALREAIAARPKAKDRADSGLAFVTKYGAPWAKDIADSPVTKETRKLLDALGIKGHRNFYALRHTFRTIADEAKDQPAADSIMGHESGHMSGVYRERIGDDRLQAVVNHVRAWLYGA